jgi:hypothetical protein
MKMKIGDNYGAAIWSSIESNVGIVCASLIHLKPLVARYAPSMLGIQRTTRLPDELSGVADNSKLRNMSRSTPSRNKSFGILTEMELEDNDEVAIARAAAHKPGTDSSGEDTDGYPMPTVPQNAAQLPFGIQKTTQVSVSFASRDGASRNSLGH